MKKMYLPIGKLCTAALAANEANVRVKNYPFDWIGHSYKTVSYIMDNGFDNLFTNYEIVDNKNWPHPRIWDVDYQTFFIHETEDDVAKIKKKYIKRYNNMINDIKNSNHIVLIQSSQCERSLYGHYKETQPFYKSELPKGKDVDDLSLVDIVNSVLKINPTINIQITKTHKVWEGIIEELKLIT